jgi:SnoaL-like protein/putative VirB-like lipoprotein
MKKLFFASFITLMLAGCNQSEQKESTASDSSSEMNNLYEANLTAYKAQVAAFEKEDLNGWASTIADTAHWSSPIFGDTIHTKAHWVDYIKSTFDNMNDLHLTDAQFLPGIDTLTEKPDGSVRYYGTWHGTYTSGKQVSVKFYGTYNFNKDHKVISGDDFYDIGGMMNAVKVQ